MSFAGAFLAAWSRRAASSLRYARVLPVVFGMVFGSAASAQTAQFGGTQSNVVSYLGVVPLSSPNSFYTQGVAVDGSGNIYIAHGCYTAPSSDTADCSVWKETPSADGYTQSNIAIGLGQLSIPSQVAVDAQGNVYVTDTHPLSAGNPNRVWKETPSGGSYTSSVVASLPSGRLAFGVAVDGSGNVYWSDAVNGNVWKETLSGGSYAESLLAGGFGYPNGVAVDGNGNVYVADSGASGIAPTVWKETPSTGSYTATSVESGLSGPSGVAVDASGNVYISNDGLYKETLSAGVYTQSTIPIFTPGLAYGTLTLSNQIAVDSSGDVYIADTGNQRVVKETGSGGNFGFANVGSTSWQQITAVFTFDEGSTLGSPALLTQGAKGLDFTDAGTGTCTAASFFYPENVCTVVVNFKPSRPGPRYGAVELLDNTGSVLAYGYLQGTGAGPQVNFTPGTAIAIDPTVNGAKLNAPFSAAVDASGNLFIADEPNNRVVEIPAGSGAPVAINPTVNGEGLHYPTGTAVDGAGNLFIVSQYNNTAVEVPAGGGTPSSLNPIVNGVGLFRPYFVAVDGAGDVFISDTPNNRVVEVQAGGGSPIAIAPTVNGESLSFPTGVALDAAGDLFIADTSNNRVVEIPSGGGTPIAIAPTVNGTGLSNPYGIALDAAGDLLIADSSNNRIVEVPAGGGTATAIDPMVNGIGLYSPTGVALDGAGDLFISDNGNNRVLELQRVQPPSVSFPTATPVGTTDTTDGTMTVQVQNIGNQTLDFTAVSYPTDFPEASGVDTDCTITKTVTAGTSCTLSIDFSPLLSSVKGSSTNLSESVSLTDNSLNGTNLKQSVSVSGTEIVTLPSLSSPSSSPLAGATTFTWSPGAGSSMFALWIGTTAGTNNLYTSGHVASTVTSETVNIPANGATLYVSLWYEINGAWSYTAYTFTEAAPPSLTSPSSSPLAGATTFTWSPGAGSTMFALWIGTAAGTNNLYTSGHVANSVTSETVNIPASGATLYVSLWYELNGYWSDTVYTFTEGAPPSLISPSSSPVGGLTTFTWSPGTGSTMFALWVGTTAGTNNLYTSGHVANTVTSETVNIPANGATLYVSLWYEVNGYWTDKTYTFTEAQAPSLTSPTTSPISGATQFTWSPGVGSTMFALWIGTSPGTNNFYTSGHVADTVTSETVNIPANGATLYVSLWYEVNGYWTDKTYTFTEEP